MKKIIISTTALKNAMKTALKAAQKNTALPILENFLCEVSHTPRGYVLTVTASDLEINISVSVDCEAKEVFQFCLPVAELKLIEKLDEQPLTLSVCCETFQVLISTEVENVKIAGENAEDFPRIPKFNAGEFLGTVENDFFPEIKTLVKYVGGDDFRPAMTGIFFEVSEDGYNLCATDAHILKTSKMKGEIVQIDILPKEDGETYFKNAILPAKFCKLISSFDSEESINVCKNENTFFIQFKDTKRQNITISTRVINAHYPDYTAVIPTNNPITVTAEIKPLLKLIDKAVLYANSTTKQGIFSVNGDIKISSQDLDFSKEYSGRMNHLKHTGADIEIGFNLDFFSKILKDINAENVTLEMSKPTRAGVIKSGPGGNCTTLVMPIMINV